MQKPRRTLPVLLLAAALVVPLGVGGAFAEEQPVPGKDAGDAEIKSLVAQLGHDDFRVRESASRKLAALGEKARAALTEAAKNDKSLETRWRAQQLLRRLSKATAPKPVDPEKPELVPDNPLGPDNPFGNQEEMEKFRRSLEEFKKRMGDWGRIGSRLGPMFGGTIRAPGLELVKTPNGVKLSKMLYVNDKEVKRETFEGRTLDEILEKNPELRKHGSMKELQSKVKALDPMQQLRDLLGGSIRITPGRMGGFSSVRSSDGVSVREDANGAHVTIMDQDENGHMVKKEYSGASLEEIKKQHPEIAHRLKKLGDIELRFMKPQIFGLGRGPRNQAPPRPPVITPSRSARSYFGVNITPADELLTMHLGLEKGHGVVVASVVPKSQAETMGLQRGDILVAVDDQPIASLAQASKILKAAAQNNGSLRIELIRRGKRQTLTR